MRSDISAMKTGTINLIQLRNYVYIYCKRKLDCITSNFAEVFKEKLSYILVMCVLYWTIRFNNGYGPITSVSVYKLLL